MLIPQESRIPLQDKFFDLFPTVGLHVPEERHLLRNIESLIVTRGCKTNQALAKSQPEGTDRSCLSRHFDGKWCAAELLEAGRETWHVLWNKENSAAQRNGVVYHIIDDTSNPHSPAKTCRPWERSALSMEAVDQHYDHNTGQTIPAHSVVTSHVVCGPHSVPWKHDVYRRKDDCDHAGISFRSKIDIACDFVATFQAPEGAERVCHLADSWYMNGRLIETVRERDGDLLIGAASLKTRLDYGPRGLDGGRLSLLALRLKSQDLDTVTVKGKRYEFWRYEGELFGQPDMVVLIVREKGKTAWTAIACTDSALSSEEIIGHYLVRWEIEKGHWYLKCALGFGDYRMRSLEAIKRFWCEVILTYWYLEWLRHEKKLPNLAEAQRVFIKDYERRYVIYLLQLFSQHKTIDEVLAVLHIAA